eukprot:972881-Pleurochrysis_carterae.AAC.1
MAMDIKTPVMNLFGVLNPRLRNLTGEIKGVQGLKFNRDLISAHLSERDFKSATFLTGVYFRTP